MTAMIFYYCPMVLKGHKKTSRVLPPTLRTVSFLFFLPRDEQCYVPPPIACYCEADLICATNPTLQGPSTAQASPLCDTRGVRIRLFSWDITPPTSGTWNAVHNHRFGCIGDVSGAEAAQYSSLPTDMADTSAYFIDGAGGGCCCSNLHDFVQFLCLFVCADSLRRCSFVICTC
jgi:hypothetical protein